MSRRVLLIDADPDFRDTLTAQLGRYSVGVITEPDADRAIAICASDSPELLMIAVEEPEKAGFRAFQKARKTLPAKLPIILVTGSMAADSFSKHRGLKVHADEYIDKRDVSADELVGKIDNLIGLGDLQDDLPIPVDDDIPMELADGDVVLDEQLEEAPEVSSGGFDVHSMQTVGPNAGVTVDQMVSAETDAAFDALMGDESLSRDPEAVPAPAPERLPAGKLPGHADYEDRATSVGDEPPGVTGPSPAGRFYDPGLDEDSAIPEPVPHKIPDEPSGTADGVPMAAAELDSVPAPILDSKLDVGHAESARAASELSSEQPVHVEAPVEPLTETHDSAKDSLSSIPMVDDDLVSLDDDVIEEVGEPSSPVPQPIAAVNREPSGATTKEPSGATPKEPSGAIPRPIGREPTPQHDTVLREPIIPDGARKSATHSAVDLGLDKLAQDAESEQSGVYDRKSLRKIGELERQIAQLKTELERARAAADATDKGGARESQFLKLREERLAKDTELKQVKTKLDHHTKELAETQEKLRQALAAKTNLETKSEELEVEVTEIRAKNKELAAGLKDATSQASQLEQELEARTKAAATAEKALAQAEKDLAGERATRASSASDSERQVRLERDQLLARHKGEMAMLRAETEAATELALARLREDVEVEKQQAINEAIEETRRLAAQDRADAIAEIEKQHNALLLDNKRKQADELSAAKRELEAEIDRLRSAAIETQAAHVAALAAAEGQHAAEIDHLKAQHEADVEARQEEHADARERDSISHGQALNQLKQHLDRTVEAHETQLSKLATSHEEETAQLESAHRHAIADLRSRNDQEVAQLTDAAKRQIENHRAELADEQAKHTSLLAAAHDTAERELAEQRALLQAAQRELEDTTARFTAEHEATDQAHAAAITDLQAKHERALAIANGEHQKAKAAADAAHREAIASLKAEADRMLRQLEEERDRHVRELSTECEELKQGLSGARDSLRQSQGELASAVQTIADRNHELRSHMQAIGERDQRIAQLRTEIEALEQENANYQEQVLRAYQKIKADEAMVARARKAMAIALTVLDDQGNPTSS